MKNNGNFEMTPLICSCGLLGLYILLKLFSKEHIRLLPSVPITVLIVYILAHKISPLMDISHCPLVAWVVPVWYLAQKHWMANNLLTMMVSAINIIEQDHLNDLVLSRWLC